MGTLERRVAYLERAAPTAHLVSLTVSAGSAEELQAEVSYLRCDGGRCWQRVTGESEADFRERACQGAKRNGYGIAMLYAFD